TEYVASTLTQLAELPAKIQLDAADISAKAENNLLIIDDCESRGEEVAAELKTCELSLTMLREPLDHIRESITARKQVLSPLQSINGATNGSKPERNGTSKRELITLAGEK
ncbi:MAG: hypothetical protein AAB288_12085, partial [Acidobacteriota bacterium]